MLSYEEAFSFVKSTDQYGSVLGLDSMRALMNELGNPQDSLSCIQVAGTNGKGSVCAFLASILSEAGYRIGKYNSPALTDERDIIYVDGIKISEADYSEAIDAIADACRRMTEKGCNHPTRFEVETAVAFLHFAKKQCDYVVLETGMGGRDDATNIVKHNVAAVLTSISLDHMHILGNSLEEIADIKAGIIKPGSIVTAYENTESVENVIKRHADENDVEVTFVSATDIITSELADTFYYEGFLRPLSVSMQGTFQRMNASLAVCTILLMRKAGIEVPDDAIVTGILQTYWPYRFEKVCDNPLTVLDGAHNPDAALSLRDSYYTYYSERKVILLFGMFKDKDYRQVTSILAPLAQTVITVMTPDSARALPADVLAECCREYCDDVYSYNDLREGFEQAYRMAGADKNTMLLVCGSLSFLARCRQMLDLKSSELSMPRIDRILQNEEFRLHINAIEEAEKERIYCKHGWKHFIDVARIGMIIALREHMDCSPDIIYAAALLHDIGRMEQYSQGCDHEQASACVAERILRECDFSEKEANIILEAIRSHRDKNVAKMRNLSGILYRADKLSRECFCCNAADTCHKPINERNLHLKY